MANNELYNDFLKRVGGILSAAQEHAAPRGLAERIMSRIQQEAAEALGWSLRPALAASAVVVVLVVAALQVPERPAHKGPSPEILSFTADKSNISPSEPVTLRWRVANADKVIVEHPRAAVLQQETGESVTFSLQEPGSYKFILIAMSGDEAARSPLDANP